MMRLCVFVVSRFTNPISLCIAETMRHFSYFRYGEIRPDILVAPSRCMLCNCAIPGNPEQNDSSDSILRT